MGHLDDDDVVKLLSGESSSGAASRHVARCERCAEWVAGVQSARMTLLAHSGFPTSARADCLDELEVAALAEGALGGADPEAATAPLASCVRCRVAVSTVARARGASQIEPELGPRSRYRGPRSMRAVLPMGLGAAAVAALLLGRLERPVDGGGSPHREGPAPSSAAPVVIAPLGPTTAVRVLRWHSVPGADMYRITLFDERGTVLYEASVSDTLVALPSDIELESGSSHYWIVSARTGFDRWDTSTLAEFTTTGPGR